MFHFFEIKQTQGNDNGKERTKDRNRVKIEKDQEKRKERIHGCKEKNNQYKGNTKVGEKREEGRRMINEEQLASMSDIYER